MPIYQTEITSSYSTRWFQRGLINAVKGVVFFIILIIVLGSLGIYYTALWYRVPFSDVFDQLRGEAESIGNQLLSE